MENEQLKDHGIVIDAELRNSQISEDSTKSKSSDESAYEKVSGHQQATRQSTVSGDSQSSGESVQVGIHHPIKDLNHTDVKALNKTNGPSTSGHYSSLVNDHGIVIDAELRNSQISEDSTESKSSDESAYEKVSGHQQATRQSSISGDSLSSGESAQSIRQIQSRTLHVLQTSFLTDAKVLTKTNGPSTSGHYSRLVDSSYGLGYNRQVGSRVIDARNINPQYIQQHNRRGHFSQYESPMAYSSEGDRCSDVIFDGNVSIRRIVRAQNRQRISTIDTTVDENELKESQNHTQHEEKSLSIKYKCLILLIVLGISIAGITVTIHFLKETYPDAFSGFLIDEDEKIYDTPIKTVLLGDERTFTFHIDRIVVEDITVINISTPIMDNEGDEISVPYSFGKVSKRSSDDWIASYNPNTQMMTIIGPPAKCSSSGPHIVKFMNDVFVIIDTISVQLAVKSDVGQTTLSLEQYGDLDVNQFTCVYVHGCQRSDLEFVVDIDDEDIIYNGINSSSTVTFNETKGFVETYKINMTEKLEQKANLIKCQSRAKTNSTDDINSRKSSVSILPLKAIACDIDNDCNFTCNNRNGDNYYAASPLRCDKFYRCVNDVTYSFTCPSGTFFDSSPNVCTCGFKKDLPWCNNDGSLKEGVDVAEKVCG